MFKQIGSDKFSTREYEASKKWKLDDSSDAFTFHAGANIEFDNQNPTRNESGTSISAVYELIRHLYYRQNGNAYDRFGVLDLSQMNRQRVLDSPIMNLTPSTYFFEISISNLKAQSLILKTKFPQKSNLTNSVQRQTLQ